MGKKNKYSSYQRGTVESIIYNLQNRLFGTGADISDTFSYDNNSMNSYVK